MRVERDYQSSGEKLPRETKADAMPPGRLLAARPFEPNRAQEG